MTAILKVCLVGPQGVGKTSLVKRFSEGTFEREYIRTLGVAISKREVPPDPLHPGGPITLVLWDIMGDYDFFSEVAEAYLQGANGIVAVLDLTRGETVGGLLRWGEATRAKLPRAVGVIAANKADLVDQRRVGQGELQGLARRLGWSVVETSALTGAGVEEAFRTVANRFRRGSHPSGP